MPPYLGYCKELKRYHELSDFHLNKRHYHVCMACGETMRRHG